VLVLYSVGTFVGILTAPSIGRLVDRFGPRRLIVPVVLTLAGACVFMAWRGRMSLALGFVLRAPRHRRLSPSARRWSSVVRSVSRPGHRPGDDGAGFGGLIVPPFAERIMHANGWRSAYWRSALRARHHAAVGLAFYRDRPGGHTDRDFGRPGRSISADVGHGSRSRKPRRRRCSGISPPHPLVNAVTGPSARPCRRWQRLTDRGAAIEQKGRVDGVDEEGEA